MFRAFRHLHWVNCKTKQKQQRSVQPVLHPHQKFRTAHPHHLIGSKSEIV
uniref:Uncharacterized protein n=1 Tax=Arundo donax TaxID=35708 RepID=A0A0A9FPC8_ARUDO